MVLKTQDTQVIQNETVPAIDSKMNEGTSRTSRVRFSANPDTFSEEEEADIRHKRLLRYWYKGGRRYSEAEKAFLSRVRIPSVGLLSDGETKVGWLRFFDPGGDRLYYWLLIVSVAVVYNSWVLILRSSFPELHKRHEIVWMVIDYLCDIIYVLDFFVSSRTGYMEDGIMQKDIQKMRKHYVHTRAFYLDAMSVVPLDIAYFFIEREPAIRMNRLIKYHRFWHFLDRTESRTSYPNLFRLASLMQFILVIIHWNACIYFIVSRKIGFGSDSWVYPGIKEGGGNLTDLHMSLTRKYIYSFYWSTLTLTTIGEVPPPHSNEEYLIVTIDYLIGVLLFATIVGNVGSIITNQNAGKVDFQNKMDGIKSYMRFHKIPQHLQQRVIKWFDYLWMNKKHPDEEELLQSLPDKLRAELAIHVHLDSLRKVEIFQDCEAGFLSELVLRLRPQLFSPGDYVCRKGEVGREMYIVNRGKLEVVSETGTKVYAVLEAGSYFGEISVLCMSAAGNRRTASVRSVGYSELFCLSKHDLMEVLDEYPEIKTKIESIAKQRLENDKRRTSVLLSNKHDKNRTNENCSDTEPRVKSRAFAKLEERIVVLERERDNILEEMRRQREEFSNRLADLETSVAQLSRERVRPTSRSFDFVWKRR